MRVKITNDGLIVAPKGVVIGRWLRESAFVRFSLWGRSFVVDSTVNWKSIIRNAVEGK
jgi:hypothetical protein